MDGHRAAANSFRLDLRIEVFVLAYLRAILDPN